MLYIYNHFKTSKFIITGPLSCNITTLIVSDMEGTSCDVIIVLERSTLLHSPSKVTEGLSVGYEILLVVVWHHLFVISWSKYMLGFPQSQSILSSHDQLEFSLFFRGHQKSPFTAQTAGKLSAIRAVQGEHERVQE